MRPLGWAILVLALPLALLAAFHAPNEYRATLGIDALDCDGPYEVYAFALPALLIYGAGCAVNLVRWRQRSSMIAALFCLAVCALVFTNVARAAAEDRRQAVACKD